jgi:predicted neutral ceramidase superfamily lipid hydrolase
MNPIRRNPLAIAVASIVYFMLGGVWFTFFKQSWLDGIGRTIDQLTQRQSGINPAISYFVAIVTTIIIALTLDWAIQATGPQTAVRGIKIAALLWFGFIFTVIAAEYAFEIRTPQTLAIVTGYPLTGMILMGAILGAWKKKV